ncbi:O-methyltransferase [Streptomyces flaveolus]|uniref:hypothetical protein n=1 Tax=Streptomyces flaveolus TaxID=67297 RepID=UPI0036F9D447
MSVERDPRRARIAAEVFADRPGVEVLTGDRTRIGERGPYDLLVLDGGGRGTSEHDPAADVGRLLARGGTVVLDDFTPATEGPPTHEGRVDRARLRRLAHPALHTVQMPLAPDLAALVGTPRRPGERGRVT